jgi:hypothetical protein
MSAIIVNGSTPFGGMSNDAIANLITAIEDVHRVNLAAAAAQSGAPEPIGATLETGSNFGVMPDENEPGKQGAAYSYALDVLDQALQAFLAANQAQITALDNGGS